jgi:predicted site-specific integrase-resolvase
MVNAIYSTRQVADILGVETWRIQRVFEDGMLPEPERFAGKRAIPPSLVPQIVDALRQRDWLPKSEEAACAD